MTEPRTAIPSSITSDHTPGPWTAVSDEQVPERGVVYITGCGRYDKNETIGEAYKTDRDVDEGDLVETEANARLMAAAPILLTALKRILSQIEGAGRNNGLRAWSHFCKEIAQDAISKVEG